MKIKIFKIKAKSIFTRTKIPGAKWVINQYKKIFEPFSPPNEKRIKTLKILKDNKITTYTFISPIIPGLIDLKEIIKKTKSFSDFYWLEFINLKLAGEEFVEVLKENFPESFEIIKNKAKLASFVKECLRIANSEKINLKGIEIH